MEKLSNKDIKEKINQILFELGDLVKNKRKEKAIKISDLSKLSGVSSSVISDFENHKGVMPSIFTLFSIMYYLEISSSETINKFSPIQSKEENKKLEGNNYSLIKMGLLGIGLSNDECKEIIDFIRFKAKDKVKNLNFYT